MMTALTYLMENLKFKINKEKYWKDRLYYLNDTGVWRQMNVQKYNQKREKLKQIFLDLCTTENINFETSKFLEIGIGDGFYTQLLYENRVKDYIGIDISDVLFDKFKNKFNGFIFQKMDITKQNLAGKFDVILLIDTIQHITARGKFIFIMNNIKEYLSEKGVFVVTSFLNDEKDSFYEKSYSLEDFKFIFSNYNFSTPIQFNDKHIFTIRK